MARALSNVKIFFSAFSNGIVLSSRKFSSSSSAALAGKEMLEEKAALIKGMKKSGSATSDAAEAQMYWVPGPVTGYYRPANNLHEIDSVELRQKFLNNKK